MLAFVATVVLVAGLAMLVNLVGSQPLKLEVSIQQAPQNPYSTDKVELNSRQYDNGQTMHTGCA